MGLQLAKDLKVENKNTGVQLEYWKIKQMIMNWHEQKAIIELIGFVSKAVRDAGGRSLDQKHHIFEDGDFDFDFTDNIVEKAYNKIKTLDTWKDATDVIE